MVGLIAMKFGTVMHIALLPLVVKIFHSWKSRMADTSAILKTIKSPYLSNVLTDQHHAALPVLPDKTANNITTKLASVSLSCKSHRSKTSNIIIVSTNSIHSS